MLSSVVEASLNEIRHRYDTGSVFDLFAAFAAASGKTIRTQKAETEGLRLLLNATLVGGLRWKPCEAAAIEHAFGIDGKFRIDETVYAQAVDAGNKSACESIENHLNRIPWFWPSEVRTTGPFGRGVGARVAVGSQVYLDDEWWDVTSLNADKLTICAYSYYRNENMKRLLKSRRTLTRNQVAALFNRETFTQAEV